MENLNEKIEDIVEILELIREKFKSPDINILRSSFDTIEEVISELEAHIFKIKKEDFSTIGKLIVLFAPTSDLQEIAIDSGWGQLFLNISERFDKAVKELIEEFKIKPYC